MAVAASRNHNLQSPVVWAYFTIGMIQSSTEDWKRNKWIHSFWEWVKKKRLLLYNATAIFLVTWFVLHNIKTHILLSKVLSLEWWFLASLCHDLYFIKQSFNLLTLFLHYYLNKFILCWSLSYSISLIIWVFFFFKNMSWLCAYLLIHHGHLANFFWWFLLGGEEEGDANPGYFTVLCRHSLPPSIFFSCTHYGSRLDKDKQLSIILALFIRNERIGLIPQPQRRKYVMQIHNQKLKQNGPSKSKPIHLQ